MFTRIVECVRLVGQRVKVAAARGEAGVEGRDRSLRLSLAQLDIAKVTVSEKFEAKRNSCDDWWCR